MLFHHGPGDGQPQAGSVRGMGPGRLGAVEFVVDPTQGLLLDADPRVRQLQDQVAGSLREGEAHGTAPGSVPDGIPQEVGQEVGEAVGIGGHLRKF